jgi:hypothetical protein
MALDVLIIKKLKIALGLWVVILGVALASTAPDFDNAIKAGAKAVDRDQPKEALSHYQQALTIARDPQQHKDARFNIARIQMWLGAYLQAEKQYRWLLQQTLDQQEYELALAGLVQSLAYRDRPRNAYEAIPKKLQYSEPELVVAATQAALWSDWPDLAKNILASHQTSLKDVTPDSTLGRNIREVKRDTALWTAPYNLTPGFSLQTDSDDFDILRTGLGLTRNWSYEWQTTLATDYTYYTQGSRVVNAERFQVQQLWRPTRELAVTGSVRPTIYENWYPVLWSLGAAYHPNDTFMMEVATLRNVVEAFPALEQHIAQQIYQVSATLNPLPYVQLMAGYDFDAFSDNNARNGYFLQASALVFPQYGLTFALLSHGFFDDFYTNSYFSPVTYTQSLFLAKWSRKFNTNWRYFLNAGLGAQTILQTHSASTIVSPSWLIDVGVSGIVSQNLQVNAGYGFHQQALSSSGGGSGYWYQLASLSVTLFF